MHFRLVSFVMIITVKMIVRMTLTSILSTSWVASPPNKYIINFWLLFFSVHSAVWLIENEILTTTKWNTWILLGGSWLQLRNCIHFWWGPRYLFVHVNQFYDFERFNCHWLALIVCLCADVKEQKCIEIRNRKWVKLSSKIFDWT